MVSVTGQERNLLFPPTGINLTVSLPLFFFINLPLNSFSALHSRLKMMPELLTGWVDATICRLHQIGISPCVQLTITIREDLIWQVHYIGWHDSRQELVLFSQFHLLWQFMWPDICDQCQQVWYIGKPDEKCDSPLSSHESGIFLNHSGMFLLCLQIILYLKTIYYNYCHVECSAGTRSAAVSQ